MKTFKTFINERGGRITNSLHRSDDPKKDAKIVDKIHKKVDKASRHRIFRDPEHQKSFERSLKKEDANLAELSKKTLTSYKDKAGKSAEVHDIIGTNAVKGSKESEKHARKAMNRRVGSLRATKKLEKK